MCTSYILHRGTLLATWLSFLPPFLYSTLPSPPLLDPTQSQTVANHLSDVGHQVVGDAVGVFADVAAAVRSRRVEVPEAFDGPVASLLAVDEVFQDLLDHELRAPCERQHVSYSHILERVSNQHVLQVLA